MLEAADDIAYLTADIEDAQHKGIVSVACLKDFLQKEEKDAVVKHILEEIDRYGQDAKNAKYPDIDGYIIHRVRVLIKGVMIDAMNDAFNTQYEQIMEGTCENELISQSKVAVLASVLRKIEEEKIYYSNNIVVSKTRAFKILYKLLDTYVPAVLSYNSKDSKKDVATNLLFLSLSENYRFVCEQANKGLDDNDPRRIYNKLLLITDQISGMTDSRAVTVYRMITAS